MLGLDKKFCQGLGMPSLLVCRTYHLVIAIWLESFNIDYNIRRQRQLILAYTYKRNVQLPSPPQSI